MVALYFACSDVVSNKDKLENGKVSIFQIPTKDIKNYNSDTVSVLSNLVQMDNNFMLFDKEMKNKLKKYEIEERELQSRLQSYLLDSKGMIVHDKAELKYYNPPLQSNDGSLIVAKIERDPIYEIESAIQKINKKLTNLEYLDRNQTRYIHFIRQEKNYFEDKIDEQSDLQKVVCVRAKMNNPRIIRQNGLFLLFGMGKTKRDPIYFRDENPDEDATICENDWDISTIIISSEAKADILEQLRLLGISEATLMPEIDVVAKSIKEQYKFKKSNINLNKMEYKSD